MIFSSVAFLFYFLPILLVVYYLVPQKLKNGVMILASFVFFAWGEIRFIPTMLVLSVIDFFCGRMMERYRQNKKIRLIFMLIGVLSNLGVLLYYKYTPFFFENINLVFNLNLAIPSIILPIGVSFNSFQSISYNIDVYRGTTSCEKKYYDYLCYTTLFPQIIAGPIVRYVTVEKDLDDHQLTRDSLSQGMRRFLVGLGKKVLIADSMALLWKEIIEGSAGEATVLLYWIGIIAFTFNIYFDFSAYSDMAIGLARVFGLNFSENFKDPYVSRSITEFWRRWHITLSEWFRDYVYIPLGGNRKGPWVQLRNILVVWALTGFWHGASWNFVIWGLYFAVILLIEKFVLLRFWEKVPRVFQHIYTMLLVMVGWVIFESSNFTNGLKLSGYLKGMFGFGNLPLFDDRAIFYFTQYIFIFILCAYLSTGHLQKLITKSELSQSKLKWSFVSVAYIVVFLACVASIVTGTYSPFLYFRF